MSYTLSGFAGSTLANPTTDDEALISVGAVVTLFDDGDKLGGELPMGHVVDIDRISVSGSAHDFRQSDSVSITLDPGDSYYLSASLAAQVAIGGQGIADAGQTLTLGFTAGDTSQLDILLAVPEPSTYALVSVGLMVTCLSYGEGDAFEVLLVWSNAVYLRGVQAFTRSVARRLPLFNHTSYELDRISGPDDAMAQGRTAKSYLSRRTTSLYRYLPLTSQAPFSCSETDTDGRPPLRSVPGVAVPAWPGAQLLTLTAPVGGHLADGPLDPRRVGGVTLADCRDSMGALSMSALFGCNHCHQNQRHHSHCEPSQDAQGANDERAHDSLASQYRLFPAVYSGNSEHLRTQFARRQLPAAL